MARSGGINALKAKAIKASLYQGSFKYRHGGNSTPRPVVFQKLIVPDEVKDTNNELWEKDIKEAVGLSYKTLREKLALYMRLPLCVFI